MHFAVDIREACRPNRSGKGQWVAGFIDELLHRNIDVSLCSDAPPPDHWSLLAKNVLLFPSGLRWHWKVSRYVQRHREIHVYVSPTSFLVPCLLPQSVHVVPVVHDLIAFRGDPHNMKATCIEKITLRCCLRKSRYVLTVSESTKSDILDRYSFLAPSAVTVVYAGPFSTTAIPNTSDGKTILCPATLCPRKNQKRLILAYRSLPLSLRNQYVLVLVGNRGWHDQDIVDLAEDTDGVEWLQYVSNDQYEHLLQTCDIVAMPSLYEGFGMQVLDALQRGIPVLTSDRGSLKEVTGGYAVLVQPEIVEDIARGLESILTNECMRKNLRERGPKQASQFTWNRTVDAFLAATAKIPW
jgi:glycosyltransferase involved in cell wall biosynthesis